MLNAYSAFERVLTVKKKKIHLLVLCALMTVMISFCIPVSAVSETYETAEETLELLSGKTAGVMTGTPQDAIILAKIPDATRSV